MITTAELRIGNWVMSNETNPAHLLIISANDMGTFYESIQDDLYGIPLAADWLERSGFEPGCNSLDIADVWFLNFDRDGVMCLQYEEDEGTHYVCKHHDMTHIKFLHQLQNLYFALTGRELEVKL